MRKKLKKYTGGGTTPTGAFTAGAGFSGTGLGQGIGMFGGMAGNAINQWDQADGHMSAGGALAGGALKGASMGAALGPAGMLIGGGIGMITGLMQRDKFNDEAARQEAAKREAERMRQNALKRSEYEQQQQILAQHPVAGNSTPRFAYGGPTGGGERYHAIPNYGGSMDPNAKPSMDFYFQGQKMPAADFIKQLPQGMDINQVAAYGMDKAQPMFDPKTGWSNVGVNDYMRSFAASQGNTPTYAIGGSTIPTGGTVTPEQATASYTKPQIRQWHPSNMDLLREAFTAHNRAPDSTFENAMEMIDPTGISSWDDAYRANAVEYGTPYTADQTLDTVGALPLFGKGKTGFTLGKSALAKFKQGFKNDMARGYDILKQGANYLNVADGLEDETGFLNGFAYGGETMGPQYEAEGGEMIQYQRGDMPTVYGKGGITPVSSQEYEIKGPSHAQGGVDMSDEKGARIYSNKLTVDPELMAKLNSL